VRKALCGHEIATVQTTAIDKEAGLIRLTTTLAHASGEWLSSEWPVCPIAETAAPRSMGAALTYARRYALFTLVGIAGEDDLDAPDLGGKVDAIPNVGSVVGVAADTQPARAPDERPSAPVALLRKEKAVRLPRIILGPEQSGALRERLLADLGQLQSADEAADWVHKNLAAKNTLISADADLVEAGFRKRLPTIDGASAAADGQLDAARVENAWDLSGSPLVASPAEGTATTIILSGPGSTRGPRLAAKTICLVTSSTASSLRRSHVWPAAGRRPRHITFVSPNLARSAEKSATSIRSQSAASIIASCTDMATKPHGGPE
jgi:hypothetical protein